MRRTDSYARQQRRKRIILAVVSLFFLLCHKNRSYEVHIGQPFYPWNQPSYARFLGSDVLRNQSEGDCRLQGIYTKPDADLIPQPMLRYFVAGVGLHYALLSTELDAEDGDLVEVEGRVVQREIAMEKIQRVRKEEVLSPESVRIVRRSSQLKGMIQNEYQRIRNRLQQEMTPEGSRLILPDKPRWTIVWQQKDDAYIIGTRFADVMYQAEIDFIWSGEREVLKEVYAVEWFKGE
jgi:hypothetical protein